MNDDPFSGFRPPDLPPDLRAAVLRAAREEFDRAGSGGAPAPDRWRRLVGSRAVRLAWAASVILLAAAHLALPRGPAAVPSQEVLAPRLEPEVGVVATLPRIDERVFAARSGERS